MSGLLRAEALRFRKRRSLQVIVAAVPLLAAFVFLASFSSLGPRPPEFDPAAVRADLIAQGYTIGLPPEEAEQALDDAVESERFPTDQMRQQHDLYLANFSFPRSIVSLLGSATFLLFALVLLVATTIGDEFGWGTIRTTLLASSHRARLLSVRLAVILAIALGLIGALILLGAILPLILAITGAESVPGPDLNLGALGVLVVGILEAALLIVAFAAMATLLVRSGSLTLVVMLVYVAVEAVILTVLLRFPVFQDQGALAWVIDAFPVRGISRLLDGAGHVASALPRFAEDAVQTDLGFANVPLVALLIWAGVFLAIAYRRFTRMDIVE